MNENLRYHSAYLAQKTSELMSPVAGIIESARAMMESAKPLEDEGLVSDLNKLSEAGLALRSRLERILDPVHVGGRDLPEVLASLPSEERHDLRTPLNHIIGYGEMLLEDGEEAGDWPFLGDLQKVLEWGRFVLENLDCLLARSRGEGPADDGAQHLHWIEDALKKIGPDSRPREREVVTGRLLCVDDDAVNRDILCRHLERDGHETVRAESGEQALEILRKESIDIVLLDLLMPGMSGMEVLHHIYSDEKLRDVPVIMLSALDELDTVARCIEMGAVDYIQKPFNAVLLKARIEASLEQKRFRDRERGYLETIDKEQQRSDRLIRAIFPDEIVSELKTTDTVVPRRHENVAVLFSDIVGFTKYCDVHTPEEVVSRLQQLVESFEQLGVDRGILKIKTIGDAYMASAGLLGPLDNPVRTCVEYGQRMLDTTRELVPDWGIRIGIHVGPVVAGVLGRRQFLFDLFGDTVNTASRMESGGVPGRITLSEAAWRHIEGEAEGEERRVDVKGKGSMGMMVFGGWV